MWQGRLKLFKHERINSNVSEVTFRGKRIYRHEEEVFLRESEHEEARKQEFS